MCQQKEYCPALPQAFVERTARLIGAAECKALCAALAGVPPVSVRINRGKKGVVPENVAAEPVAWCETGRYLLERPSFTLDPVFHAGGYYVQEASSMFVEQAFRQLGEPPRRVLDLCAAPGGKSTLWRSLLPERGALLVSNEPLRQRADVLAENMAKWGHPDVVVTCAWPAAFAALGSFFDVIAADVPCSGEGMFRKDAGAIGEWSEAGVTRCAERQLGIVRDVWPALREGGCLLYSTCTFNREENEDNVWRICKELGAETVPVPSEPEWGICGDVTGRSLEVSRFFPHRARGEGFFMALLRKTSAGARARASRKAAKARRVPLADYKAVRAWLADDDFVCSSPDAAHVSAVRAGWAADADLLRATVNVISAGVVVAEAKGRKWVPAPELALSTALSEEAFPRVALSPRQALAFLRREASELPGDVPRGYVLATFEDRPLGFLNNLGNRANNQYPPAWRIRKQL